MVALAATYYGAAFANGVKPNQISGKAAASAAKMAAAAWRNLGADNGAEKRRRRRRRRSEISNRRVSVKALVVSSQNAARNQT